MAAPLAKSLDRLLKEVSRSFYLTLRVLPSAVRPQIGLAYLLARTTDTIADTELIPLAQRLDALAAFRQRILGHSDAPLLWTEFLGKQGLPAERRLLERREEVLTVLASLLPADQRLVRDVLNVITSGQELDLTRFQSRESTPVSALTTDDELGDYTYRVAGCVGEFWTRICRAHLFPEAELDEGILVSEGIRFGQGLQLVNILRDLPGDLRRGRCYLPSDRLRADGLAPADLLDPANEPKFRPLFDQYLDEARKNLAIGWNYTNRLPRSCARVRLACAWPILIGIRTLDHLKDTPILNSGGKVKISRAEVRRILARSILLYPWPTAWKRLAPAMALSS